MTDLVVVLIASIGIYLFVSYIDWLIGKWLDGKR